MLSPDSTFNNQGISILAGASEAASELLKLTIKIVSIEKIIELV